MKGLNLAHFKKMKEDGHSATMIHKDGHQLVIAKGALSALHKKQLEKLPVHNYANGGEIPRYAEGTPDVQPPLVVEPIEGAQAPAQDPQKQVQEQSQSQVAAQPSVVTEPQTAVQAQIPGYEEEKAANLAAARAMGAQGQAEAKALGDTVNEAKALPTQNDIINSYREKDNTLQKLYGDQKLDPDHYWTTGTHSKIAAGIGILLSSVGQAMGAKGGNAALEAINTAINRDIEAQKNSQEQKLNLWKMNRAALGSDLEANLATQNQLYTGLKYKIEKAAAEQKGPLALANAQKANAQIDQAIQLNNFKLSLLNPTSDNPDPASRVQFLVPQERQQKVVDEINAAKNTVANAPGIIDAFIQSSKDTRPLSGGTSTSVKAFIPGQRTPGQQALQARLGPTFQDVEGTVRQAAMDNLDHNVSPQIGDSDNAVGTKLVSLIDYLSSKSQGAAASKSFGIDLSRFPSTNATREGLERYILQKHPEYAKYLPYKRQTINGKEYFVPVKK